MFFTPWYPTPDSPASGVFVREHVRAAALHSDVVLVHLHPEAARIPAIRIRSLEGEPFPAIRVSYASPWRLRHLLQPMAWLAAALALRRRGVRPDLVHANISTTAPPALVYARMMKAPLVVTEQWSIFLEDDPASLPRTRAAVVRWALRRAAVVLPVGRRLARAIEGFAPGATCRVVPNVVDGDVFHPGENPPEPPPVRLLAVGLLAPEKDHDTMLSAVAQIRSLGKEVQLDIVGYGPERSRVEALIAEKGLTSAVRLLGYLTKDEIASAMREAHVFLHTSKFETFGAAVAEALASGLPVVSTRCGGPEDLIEESNGALAAVGDPQSVAKAVAQIGATLGRYSRAAIAAAAMRDLSLVSVGELLEEVYCDAERRSPR